MIVLPLSVVDVDYRVRWRHARVMELLRQLDPERQRRRLRLLAEREKARAARARLRSGRGLRRIHGLAVLRRGRPG